MAKWIRGAPSFWLCMALLLALAAVALCLPDAVFSDRENRPLQQWTAPEGASIRSGRWMEQMEGYVADQLPGRDAWMGVQALWDAALLRAQRNGILIGRDGWLFEDAAGLATRTAQGNVDALAALAARIDVPVTLALVPMSSAALPQKLPAGYRPDDQAALIGGLYAGAQGVQTIDLCAALTGTAQAETFFFRTDHHWTDAGAQQGYEALLAAWGMQPAQWAADSLRAETYGSYFARAPSPLITADAFDATLPRGVTLAIEGESMPGLYDPALMDAARDKYAQLLYGNHGRCTLQSEARGGTLVVLKDSYANLLLPRLSQHFARVEAVDLRYYAGNLQDLIKETEADAVLCLYGLTTFLSDRNLALFSAQWDT